LKAILRAVAALFPETYVVGGTVRDILTGRREHHDIDFATCGVSGLDAARRIADRFGGAFYALDPERDTGRAIVYEEGQRLELDFALARGANIVDDLTDRDFTVNAMALDVHTGELLDPTGGLTDLRAGILRAISPAVFRRDPARLLRAPRQAIELKLTIEEQTRNQIARDAPLLARTSAERVRDEFCRYLALPDGPASLSELDSLGLLSQVWPELNPLKGLDQPPPHRFDAFEHTLRTVAEMEKLLPRPDESGRPKEGDRLHAEDLRVFLSETLSADRPRSLLLKLAALLHDIGKPETRTLDSVSKVHFYGHEITGAAMAAEALRRLRFAREEVTWAQRVVRHHMRPLQFVTQGMTRRAIYRFFRDAGDAGVGAAILLLADARATWGRELTAERWQKYMDVSLRLLNSYFDHRDTMFEPPPLITGRDVMAHVQIPSGPEIGRLLAQVREAQAVGEVRTRDEALALLHRLTRERGT
jgi:putative nucleotidyltransferase with HDIG domain